MIAQTEDLKAIQRAIVPENADQIPPPEVAPRSRVDWPDFLRFVKALDETLATANAPLTRKLVEAAVWVRLVGHSRFDAIRGQRLTEYLKIIRQAGGWETVLHTSAPVQPSRAGRLQFRMLAAQYARQDTLARGSRGLSGRLRLLRAALRFARGRGEISSLQPVFREVRFSALEPAFGPLSAEQEAMLTRYFRVKIQGLHFCGPAYYGVAFTEGFYSLALVFPVVLWLARWLAVGEGRDQLSTDDVARALAIADHHHGYSPALGTASARRRVRLLTHGDDLERLCLWYAR